MGTISPLISQDASNLTAAELEARFNKQKTRGLVIVPTGEQETATNSAVETATTNVLQESTYVEVERADQVNIQISFDFDSAVLRSDQKPKMATLCQVMNKMETSIFQVVGHTDSSGTEAYNQNLSLLRAKEVKRFLVDDCGVAENKIEAIGAGETSPLNQDDPRSDENRRVEFQALS